MSQLYYSHFKNEDGTQLPSSPTVDRMLRRLRHMTGRDYRMEVVKETERGFIKRRVRYWYQLYVPVPGGVLGKAAWTAFRSDNRLDAEEISNIIDGILLGIEIGRERGREDVDALRRENEELSREVRELSSERALDASSPSHHPHHLISVSETGRYFVSHQSNPEEGQYLSLLCELHAKMLAQGATDNRTATKATKVFGRTMRFDLSNGTLPLLTTKRIHLKSVAWELIWFLKGLTNNDWLRERGVTIWDEWATTEAGKDRKKQLLPAGSLGPLYGEQWRRFPAGEFFYNLTDEELRTYVKAMANDQFDKMARDLAPLDVSLGRFHTDGNPHRLSPESIGFDTPPFVEIRQYLTKVGIDQISQTLFLLKHRPNSRRIIVTAWNPQVVPSDELSPQENVKRRRAALAACHAMFQVVTEPLTFEDRAEAIRTYWKEHDNHDELLIDASNVDRFLKQGGSSFPTHRLNLSVYQRSCDTLQGVPFNVASYALLAHMLAKEANMVPGDLLWVGGDVHLYSSPRNLEAVEVQLQREPRPFPKVTLKDVPSIFDYTLDDIVVSDYHPYQRIKADIAV